jgi:short-subunit dehydrogenase
MTVQLRGARILLTGATGGIGHAIARALHTEGAELILTGRKVDVLEPLAKELGAISIATDLADADAVTRLLEEAGTLDVLVANAALPGVGNLTGMSVDHIEKNLDVNLRAPIVMTRHLLPGMLERGSGQIVLIGSVSGIVSSPGSAMYNATKFGLRGFASGLRQDLHGTGVGVSIVMPGFVRDAGMFVNSGMVLPAGVRTVSPEQVAKGVVRAIRKDKGQVVVAPAELKAGAKLGSIAPEVNATIQRLSGAADIVGGHSGTE